MATKKELKEEITRLKKDVKDWKSCYEVERGLREAAFSEGVCSGQRQITMRIARLVASLDLDMISR